MLNNEFWKENEELYPQAMQKFYEWSQRYIESNDMKGLYQPPIFSQNLLSSVSFHDLPMLLQVAMFDLFIAQIKRRNFFEDGERFIIHNLSAIENGEL